MRILAVAVLVLGGVLTAQPAYAGSTGPEHCTGLTCSFDVPPGTYRITVELGGRDAAAQTGLQVEARRTVLAPVATSAGQVRSASVTVDVRTPESMPTGEEGTGTPGLQMYLTGSAPALRAVRVTPQPRARRLFVVSDSTAADWLAGPKRGWAQELPQLFRAGLSVANYADSGESTVSWLADPSLFATVQPLVRPGDEVLIQLAHNDKTTPEDVYRANLAALIDGVRARGGVPVMVTPPVRRLFAADGTITPTGRVVNNLGVDLPAVMRDVAAQRAIPLLDLTARSRALLESLGPDGSAALYLTDLKDATHFTEYGATVMAGLVAAEMRRAHLAAACFLRDRGTR